MTQSTLKAPRKTPVETAKPNVTAAKVVRTPTHEEITERARALWEGKGRPAGLDDAIWLEAEAQLKKG